MPSVRDPLHAKVEHYVGDALKTLGFHTGNATYHSVLPDEVTQRLSSLYTPTALYLRGRADRFAIHSTRDLAFEWECKTNSGPHANMAIEAMPFLFHLIKARLGCLCLYIYDDLKQEQGTREPRGFWVHQHPPIDRIILPSRWSGDLRDWFCANFQMVLPGVRIVEVGWVSGSGDPFILVQRGDVQALPPWYDLVHQAISDAD